MFTLKLNQLRQTTLSAAVALALGLSSAPTLAQTSSLPSPDEKPQTLQELNDALNSRPPVLTPARLGTHDSTKPAGIMIITRRMLEAYGITSIAEAMRLVPGFAVNKTERGDYRVNYHGTNSVLPRRLNILIDGVSFYQPVLAQFDGWRSLPVTLDDIHEIVVTRGTNAASYGSNSALAVVNIITLHPRGQSKMTLSSGISKRVQHQLARYKGDIGDYTTYRMTVSREKDTGFDTISSDEPGNVSTNSHDTMRLDRANFRLSSMLGHNQNLDVDVSLLQGTRQVNTSPNIDGFPDIKLKQGYVNVQWKDYLDPNHGMEFKGYMTYNDSKQSIRLCSDALYFLPEVATLWDADPELAKLLLNGGPFRPPASAGSHAPLYIAARDAIIALDGALPGGARSQTCGDTNQDYTETRYDFEFQDVRVFREQLYLTSGFGLGQDAAESETFLGGKVTNKHVRAFANVRYLPTERLTFNLGAMARNDDMVGSTFSPRFAINTKLAQNQSLRFSVAKGTRSPNIYEQHGNWRYRVNNLSPGLPIGGSTVTEGAFYPRGKSPGNLKEERILAREIGYYGQLRAIDTTIDFKIFDDKLDQLISEQLKDFDFNPTNSNSVRLRGSELQLTYQTYRWLTTLSYGYLESKDATTPLEKTQYSRHSGALAISRNFKDGWQASVALYGADGKGVGQSSYGRQDLTLSKTTDFDNGNRLVTSLTARHLDNKSETYLDNDNTFTSSYDDSMEYYLRVKFMF